ncbi:MAG: AsmA family protein [Acidobacteriota bacterium]
MAKKLLIALGIVAVVAAGCIAALRLLISPEKLRPVLQVQLEDALKRKVELGDISLSLWPLGLEVHKLSIADDPRAQSTRPFATAESLQVSARLMPLFRGNVEIDSVHFGRPVIELIQIKPGLWNFDSLGGETSSGGGAVKLGAVEVTDAQIAVRTPTRARTVYSGIHLSLGALDPGRPMPVKFAALDGELSGDGTLTQQGQAKNVDFKLRMGKVQILTKGTLTARGNDTALAMETTIPNAEITELAAAAAKVGLAFSPGMNVKGSLAGTVTASGTTSAPQLSGKAQLTNLEVSGGGLKEPVRSPKLQLDFTPAVIRSQPMEMISGSTKISGLFAISDYSSAAPRLESSVWADRSNLADLLRMAQAYGVSAAQGMSASGDASFRVRVHGPMAKNSALDVSGVINSDVADVRTAETSQPLHLERTSIKFNGDTGRGEITVGKLVSDPFPLTDVSASMVTRKGVATLDPVRATLYDGQFLGTIVADTNATPPRFEVRSRMERVNSERLIAAATPLRKVVTGALFSNAQLSFANGAGKDDIARSLNGTMSLKINDGQLLAMSVLNEANKIAQFVTQAAPTPNQVTPFLALTGDVNLKDGVAATDNLLLNLESGSVQVSGSMNLVNESLNLKMITTLAKAYTDQVGGSRVGGYLTAAVLNSRGEMVIPALVTGTFSAPRVTPDAAAMAKLKLQQVIPGLTKPGALNEGVGGLLDMLKGKKKEPK